MKNLCNFRKKKSFHPNVPMDTGNPVSTTLLESCARRSKIFRSRCENDKEFLQKKLLRKQKKQNLHRNVRGQNMPVVVGRLVHYFILRFHFNVTIFNNYFNIDLSCSIGYITSSQPNNPFFKYFPFNWDRLKYYIFGIVLSYSGNGTNFCECLVAQLNNQNLNQTFCKCRSVLIFGIC